MRAIGVSNFMPGHLEQLLAGTSVVPAVNQVELHPYFTQPDVQVANAKHGILTQAWSPIGGITSYRGAEGARSTFDDEIIVGIARAHGKSSAQAMLRHWSSRRDVPSSRLLPARCSIKPARR